MTSTVLHGLIQSSWQFPCSWNVILLLLILMLLMLFMELFFNFTLQKSFLKFMSFLTNERLLQYAGRVDLCFEFEGIRNSCYCFYCYLFGMCVRVCVCFIWHFWWYSALLVLLLKCWIFECQFFEIEKRPAI